MKNILLTLASFLISSVLLAQNPVKKGDIVIHLTGSDAYGDHRYMVDIYKKGNYAKVVYAYSDSLKWSEVKVDPDYYRVHPYLAKYDSDYSKRKLIWDTIGIIFEKHTAYTRDSITLNLKTDTAYSNLLRHIMEATKADLAPKIDARVLDGDGMSITVITSDKMIQTAAYAPGVMTHPLMAGLLSKTLNKDKISRAVLKIRKFFSQY
ncbi:hypothetical protein [Mucilaginibacter sp. UR6-11]|uniref:hypothetical protein n=1 Tax=Mucilaginibacter sp. UR6-11 TaxID=1435644 RepID=UPI001E347870|nr:hypothetical protein [Mucilaginibacter sp. UR6-11]MCC8424137.1 hypothetical protein [Mucilaginibacter sp. UR6-11]